MSDYMERRINDKCDDIARDLQRLSNTQDFQHRILLKAFNDMTQAIQELTVQVRVMRDEISPGALDKPKLPSPERGA